MPERVFFKFPAYVGILLEKDSEVLLIKRANTGWMDGYWSIPGGALEEHESLLHAVTREAHEELAIQIDPVHTQLFHVEDVKTTVRRIIGFYFLARKWHGEPKNNEPNLHSDMQWFAINNLPENITSNAQQVIIHYTKAVNYSLIENM